MQILLGTRLGRYEIVDEIGRGAMGVVYKARDPNIDRVVAIKTISLAGQDPEEEQEYRERFFVEARAAGRLSHPGIVTIFDMGEDPETRDPYIVMEYVSGRTLSQVLSEKKKLPIETSLQLAQELVEALGCAHAQGVVHRDVKPANVIVTDDGHAKIADFGIAKLNQAHLTLPGEVLGSPAYMAPEQLSGQGVDSRSDLFSVGVILYSMLVGFRPFQGDSATTVCFKVVNNDPLPVSTMDSALSPEIDNVVLRAMAKDPKQRYQTGAEMAADLQRLRKITAGATESGPHRATASPMRSRSNGVAQQAQPINSLKSDKETGATKHRAAVVAITAVALLLTTAGSLTAYRIRHHMVLRPISETANRLVAKQNPGSTAIAAPAIVPQPVTVSPTKPQASRQATAAQRPVAAKLSVNIDHPFSQAQAAIWIDHRLVYKHALRGESKGSFVFRKTSGSESATLRVTPGKHEIQVQVQSEAEHYGASKAVIGDFPAGSQSTLHVVCDRRHRDLVLVVE